MTTQPNGDAEPIRFCRQDRHDERRLLKALAAYQDPTREAGLELLCFYALHQHDSVAHLIAEQLTAAPADTALRAAECLAVGARMEMAGRFGLAICYYGKGIAFEPVEPDVWYWLNNNLGYSLNQAEHYPEAEPCCRASIRCEASRYNTHKNLGASLWGQGRFPEAARSHMITAQTEPRDQRALLHLNALVRTHRDAIAEGAPEAIVFLTGGRSKS